MQTSPISFVARGKGTCNKGNRRRLHAGNRRATRRSSPRLQGKGSTHFFFLRLLGPAARIETATSRIASSCKGQILWNYPPPYSPPLPFPTSPPLRGLREQDRFFKGFLQAFFTRVSLNSGRPVCNFGVKKLTRRKSKKKKTHTHQGSGEGNGGVTL